MVGYGVGGAFLSLSYFDLPYNIMVAIILAKFFAEKELAGAQAPVPDQKLMAKWI